MIQINDFAIPKMASNEPTEFNFTIKACRYDRRNGWVVMVGQSKHSVEKRTSWSSIKISHTHHIQRNENRLTFLWNFLKSIFREILLPNSFSILMADDDWHCMYSLVQQVIIFSYTFCTCKSNIFINKLKISKFIWESRAKFRGMTPHLDNDQCVSKPQANRANSLETNHTVPRAFNWKPDVNCHFPNQLRLNENIIQCSTSYTWTPKPRQ